MEGRSGSTGLPSGSERRSGPRWADPGERHGPAFRLRLHGHTRGAPQTVRRPPYRQIGSRLGQDDIQWSAILALLLPSHPSLPQHASAERRRRRDPWKALRLRTSRWLSVAGFQMRHEVRRSGAGGTERQLSKIEFAPDAIAREGGQPHDARSPTSIITALGRAGRHSGSVPVVVAHRLALKCAIQRHKCEPERIRCPPRFHLALAVEGRLFPEEEILSSQRCLRTETRGHEP